MQKNNIDLHIANKLKDREITPSSSAWERLNTRLDTQEKKQKRNWILYLGYAASIIILLSVFLYPEIKNMNIKDVIVQTSIDSIKIKEVNIKELIPVEEAIVKTQKNISKPLINKKKNKKSNAKKELIKEEIQFKELTLVEKNKVYSKNESLVIAENTVKEPKKTARITINSNDLLYAVTHSSEEVKQYYAKYQINRNDVLDTIHKMVLKSNLKIDPEIILAEVENDINETDFKKGFIDKLKLKLSDVMVAIADRNK